VLKMRIKILMEEQNFSLQLSHEILDKSKLEVAKKLVFNSPKYAHNQKLFSF
jgi:hypothetical protein